MPTTKTITINGRAYDARTGLPINERVADAVSRIPVASKPVKAAVKTESKAAVKAELKTDSKAAGKPASTAISVEVKGKPIEAKKAIKRTAPTTATTVHRTTQRSQTLLRRASKKPVTKTTVKRPSTGRHMDMARSSKISKFAPHPVTQAPKPQVSVAPDKAPQVHPIAAKAVARKALHKPAVRKPVTSKDVKNAAITAALAVPKAKPSKATKKASKKAPSKWLRRSLIIASIVLIVSIGIYAVYHLVPSVSVGVAATQAGIKANYPKYIPDGYALSHPVAFTDGEVALKFKSNSNDNSYTITQTRSSWDSSAVLDNVVRPEAGEDYTTTKERGLTVYSYDNNAAWVNGGILYVISSDNAPLSGEQIRHIATSL